MTLVRCDLFDFSLELNSASDPRVLEFVFWTDLPSGTGVIVSMSRSYLDARGRESLWSIYDDRILVTPGVYGDFNGGKGAVDIDEGDRAALAEFEELLGDFSAGISSKVSDEIEIAFVVGGRQRLKAFGKNNSNLVGAEVTQSGGVRVVEASGKLTAPMQEEYQPLLA